MPTLEIGDAKVEYVLRRSSAAKRARITITPGKVDVVMPEAATEAQVMAVLQRRRAWILRESRRIDAKAASAPAIVRFATGAKIPFRGRLMRLKVEPGSDRLVSVTYRNGFIVSVPPEMDAAVVDRQVEIALRLWLKKRLRQDVAAFVKQHGEPNGLRPHAVRIKDQKHFWGSCGLDRVVNLNWRLIHAPKSVVEYAVVHELTHLKHRSHAHEFWGLVGAIIPDWRDRKKWLDENEHLLAMPRVIASSP